MNERLAAMIINLHGGLMAINNGNCALLVTPLEFTDECAVSEVRFIGVSAVDLVAVGQTLSASDKVR